MGCGENFLNANYLVDIREIKVPENKQFIKHDLNNLPLPFKDNFFDEVHCHHVLEHIDNTEEFLKEVLRILNYMGKLHLTIPNSVFIGYRLQYLLGIYPKDFILEHKKHFSYNYLQNLLHNIGFKVKNTRYLPHFFMREIRIEALRCRL